MARRKIRWMIITIPTSYLIFSAVALVVIAVSLSGMIFGGQFAAKRAEKAAIELLAQAKELFTQAEKEKVSRHDLSSIKTILDKTEGFIAMTDFRAARRSAEEAVQQLQYLLAADKKESDVPEGRYARIVEAQGVVEILPPNSVDWILAGAGQVLKDGTRVRTQNASTAKLKFDDESSIQMRSNSLIMIRELNEDESTQVQSSNIELGKSDIEATIKEPRVSGSSFKLTMPDNSQADIKSETNVAVSVDEKSLSVVKVFMGRVDVMSGQRQVSLSTREALIIDPKKNKPTDALQPVMMPAPPRLIYPANVQLLTMNVKTREPLNFRWTLTQEASKYKLEIAKDYYFYDNLITQESAENRAKIESVEPGNYYWRVSAVDKSGLSSEPSAFNSFRIVFDDELQSDQKDLSPPKIQIDNVSILGRIVDISGKTEPNASLFVNENKEEVFDDGSFRVLIEMRKSGFQAIQIEVYDSAGNVATSRREVTISESAMK